MPDFNSKHASNISAKMSLYSIVSIIAIIIMCTAAWKMLDLAKTTHLSSIKSSGKATSKEHLQPKENSQNPFLRKLLIGFYQMSANLQKSKDRTALKENEIRAARLLRKYSKAQEIYKSHYGYYAADSTELIIEVDSKYTIIDQTLKVLNSSYNKESPANGYYYIELVKSSSKADSGSFILSAVPAEHGISGLNTICIFKGNKRAKILKKNNGGRPVFDISAIDNNWENL